MHGGFTFILAAFTFLSFLLKLVSIALAKVYLSYKILLIYLFLLPLLGGFTIWLETRDAPFLTLGGKLRPGASWYILSLFLFFNCSSNHNICNISQHYILQITPLPGAWPQKPGSATFPFFGVQVLDMEILWHHQNINSPKSPYQCFPVLLIILVF